MKAIQRTAYKDFIVTYSNRPIIVKKGTIYYCSLDGQVLIGWHGSISPPLDMEGKSMVTELVVEKHIK